MIHFENVGKRYPAGREALSGVNFRLEKGEMAFLTGPSGAGTGGMKSRRCPTAVEAVTIDAKTSVNTRCE